MAGQAGGNPSSPPSPNLPRHHDRPMGGEGDADHQRQPPAPRRLSKGLAAVVHPAKSTTDLGGGPLATDLLELRRSTSEALSPSHHRTKAASAGLTDPPPPRPARSGERHRCEQGREGRMPYCGDRRGKGSRWALLPPEQRATSPTSACSGTAESPEPYSKNKSAEGRKTYTNLKKPTLDLTSTASGRHRCRRDSRSGRLSREELSLL
jgi:hypothetical protein